VRDGYYEKAIGTIEKFVGDNTNLDSRIKGWLLQLAARAACLWKEESKADTLQRQAYGHNYALLRPKISPAYVKLVPPSRQSENIIALLDKYELKKGFLSHFEEVADLLVQEASSNQFEESFKELGLIIGFHGQRPEHEYGKGPDVLWIIEAKKALVIEVKSRKAAKNVLTKEEHGQLLESFQWFQEQYPRVEGYKVVVHPNALATDCVTATESYALTLNNLAILLAYTRQLISELSSVPMSNSTLIAKCEKLLDDLSLTPSLFIDKFLEPFRT
jgi:hypothetical protein